MERPVKLIRANQDSMDRVFSETMVSE